jgi:hypothetical protein
MKLVIHKMVGHADSSIRYAEVLAIPVIGSGSAAWFSTMLARRKEQSR